MDSGRLGILHVILKISFTHSQIGKIIAAQYRGTKLSTRELQRRTVEETLGPEEADRSEIDGTWRQAGIRFYLLLRNQWWVVVTLSCTCAVLALTWSILQTPVYMSSTTLYVTSGADGNAQTAYQGSLASEQRVASYGGLAKSDAILSAALKATRLPISVRDARSKITVNTSADTVLFTVSATDPDPAVAATLANGVGTAMVDYVQMLERPTSGGAPLAKITVVSPATESTKPASPATKKNTALGLLVGFLLGILSILVRDRFDTRPRTVEEIETIVNRRALATIQLNEKLERRFPVDFKVGAGREAEGYRELRTNLGFISVDAPARRISVTSALPSEGKSTTSINFAAALAEAGHRVVLVDADLRRPKIAEYMNLATDTGLTSYLRGEAALRDLVQPTNVPGLAVISSGPIPPNPAELLDSERAKKAFSELAEENDYVVIDTPPVLGLSDPVLVASAVDAVLLVVFPGRITSRALHGAIRSLELARARVAGVVVNGAMRSGYGYGYGYGYTSAPIKPTANVKDHDSPLLRE